MLKNNPGPSRHRRFRFILGAVVLAALVLRLAVSAQLRQTYAPVTQPAPGTDTRTYQTFARQILDGEYDFSDGFYYQPFYYAAFLPVVYGFCGRGPWGVIICQSLLGAAAVWLTGLAFAHLFGRRAGILAAVLLALCRMHIFYTPFTLIAALQTFWMAAICYCAVRAARTGELWRWAVAALVCGLANATRGNIVLLLPFLILLQLWTMRHDRRRQLAGLVIVLAVFYLPQFPFAWVNYQAHRRWVGPSSAAGNVLALGNTPESPPGGREFGSGPMSYPESYSVWVEQEKTGRRSVAGNILQWFRRRPAAWLELKFRMLLLFWNRREIPNNVAIIEPGPSPDQPRRIGGPLLHTPVALRFGVLGALGLAGMGLTLRRGRQHPTRLFLVAAAAVYAGSIILFYVLARFRLPIMPLLCGFSAVTVLTLQRRFAAWREPQRRRPALLAAGLTALCFVFVLFGYDIYRIGWEPTVLQLVRPDGVRLEFPEKTVIKDHGPQSFGGWTPVPINDALEVRKTLVLQPEDRDKAVHIRLAVAVETPVVLDITAPGQYRRAVALDAPPRAPPLQWLTLELEPQNLVYNDNGKALQLVLHLKQVSGRGAAVVIDTQRRYGRTDIEYPLDGELVMAAELR